MTLATGKQINYYKWDLLPVREDILGRINEMAILESQIKIYENFKFEWRLEG